MIKTLFTHQSIISIKFLVKFRLRFLQSIDVNFLFREKLGERKHIQMYTFRPKNAQELNFLQIHRIKTEKEGKPSFMFSYPDLD